MAKSEIDPDAFAKKTFLLTVIGVALYVGAVYGTVLTNWASTGIPAEDEARLGEASDE